MKAYSQPALRWENEQAVSVWVPANMLEHYPVEQDSAFLFSIRIKDAESSMLGTVYTDPAGISFHPLIPFPPGNGYEIYWRNNLIESFSIPRKKGPMPTLTIFPSTDTVPENLLKIYLVFDRPMQEGQSKRYLKMVTHEGDTLDNVFLFLSPELWNADNTILTMWLDPGRIKRDLLPNQELGSPLIRDRHYTLCVLPGWRSRQGVEGDERMRRIFVASPDRTSPDVENWRISAPAKNSFDTLSISFDEQVDYGSVQNGIRIFSPQREEVYGTVVLASSALQWNFVPDKQWTPGRYQIHIETSIEDLAGNNLVRLFDTELSSQATQVETGDSIRVIRAFRVK